MPYPDQGFFDALNASVNATLAVRDTLGAAQLLFNRGLIDQAKLDAIGDAMLQEQLAIATAGAAAVQGYLGGGA